MEATQARAWRFRPMVLFISTFIRECSMIKAILAQLGEYCSGRATLHRPAGKAFLISLFLAHARLLLSNKELSHFSSTMYVKGDTLLLCNL
jgi:hypothetical protein